MRHTISFAIVLTICLQTLSAVNADVVLREDFEKPGKWRKQIRGKGKVELVAGGVTGKCVKMTTEDAGMAYYSIELPVERVRGKTLNVRAKVKLDNVVQGAQPWCRAKIHVGTWVNRKLIHRPKLFDGTADWHDQTVTAPIDEKAERVVLDLGIQMGNGTAYYDDVVVDDGLKPMMPLKLAAIANTSYSDGVAGDGRGGFIDTGCLDLRGLPVGDVLMKNAEFRLMRPGENFGATCLALRGQERPKLPSKPTAEIVVGQKGRRLLFLGAAAWLDAKRETPCLVCTVRFADDSTASIPLREGVDLGAFDAPQDLPNWRVAWTAERMGRKVGLGITEWRNPKPDVKIESISFESPGAGAVPIIVAVTLDRRG